MISKVLVFCVVVVVAGTGVMADSHLPNDIHVPAIYDFEYGVIDDPTANDFGHSESRNVDVTTGRYFVALPDGRTQVVTYRADENGFVAEITYEGEASYPDHHHNLGHGHEGYGHEGYGHGGHGHGGHGHGGHGHGGHGHGGQGHFPAPLPYNHGLGHHY